MNFFKTLWYHFFPSEPKLKVLYRFDAYLQPGSSQVLYYYIKSGKEFVEHYVEVRNDPACGFRTIAQLPRVVGKEIFPVVNVTQYLTHPSVDIRNFVKQVLF